MSVRGRKARRGPRWTGRGFLVLARWWGPRRARFALPAVVPLGAAVMSLMVTSKLSRSVRDALTIHLEHIESQTRGMAESRRCAGWRGVRVRDGRRRRRRA